MEQFRQMWHEFFRLFSKIVVWTTFAAACFVTIFWGKDAEVGIELLWQIFGISAVCSAGGVLFFSGAYHRSKTGMIATYVLSYLFINVAILAGGAVFDWFSVSDWKMVLGMVILVAVGYGGISLLYYRAAKRDAERMNEKLKERE